MSETNSKEDLEQFYFGLIGELVDLELAFFGAQERYTAMLASRGIRIDPKPLLRLLELCNDRLERLLIIKQLAVRLGLAGELDMLMAAEVELIYRAKPQPPSPSKLIVGENQNG